MNTEMVETFRYLRDNGKPISQQDAADYACIRAPQPPSKALVKRVKRAQLNLEPRRDRTDYAVPKKLERDARLDFHKLVISQLGGDLTTKTAPDAVPAARTLVFYPQAKGPIEQPSEREMAHNAARRLQRTHLVAMSKMYATEYQPDMFEILDNFGSFATYAKEL